MEKGRGETGRAQRGTALTRPAWAGAAPPLGRREGRGRRGPEGDWKEPGSGHGGTGRVAGDGHPPWAPCWHLSWDGNSMMLMTITRRKIERRWEKGYRSMTRDVASGQHVVLACSALKKMYRDILTQGKDGAALKCEESGKEAERAEMQLLVVHLSGSFEVISGRLLKRKGHFMPSELLQSQFETLEPPAAPENFIQISVDKNVSEIIAKIMETLKMK
nr:probable gluconokinase isoform X6 [Chlorocebus sabaeus]